MSKKGQSKKSKSSEKWSKIYNLTPHPVNIITSDTVITIPSSGVVRLKEDKTTPPAPYPTHIIFRSGQQEYEIPVMAKQLTSIEGLPDLAEGSVVIVSSVVAPALQREHPELLVLVPGDADRDEKGNVVGVRNLHILLS